MMEEHYKHAAIEALILASPEPLPTRKITQLVEDVTPSKVAEAVTILNTRYAETGSSFRIRELAGGYQFYVLPEYVRFIEELFSSRRRLRLTRAALETIAIVAYRQPVSKADIEHIRGVASDGVLRTLLEKNLVTVTGRADTVGKPLQYGTTDEFLKFFGLARLEDLPQMSEIEQLISATESKDQTELTFELLDESDSVKLNIADGTFNPQRRAEVDDDAAGKIVDNRAVEPGDDDSDTGDDPGRDHRRLELKRPAGEGVDESEGPAYSEEESEDDFDEHMEQSEDQETGVAEGEDEDEDEPESDNLVVKNHSVASES